MEDLYLYDKEKDERLEAVCTKIASLPTDEERLEYIKEIPLETRGELISYMKWENAKARSKRLQAEARAEVLKEKNLKLRQEKENLTRDIHETLKAIEALNNSALFSAIGDA